MKQFCSLYDLANVVPTLAKFYHQASESYEQACTRHINMIIYYVSCLFHDCVIFLYSACALLLLYLSLMRYLRPVLSPQQFERLFQFARRIEDLMYTITPEEVSSVFFFSTGY